jgi:hypothetical protein
MRNRSKGYSVTPRAALLSTAHGLRFEGQWSEEFLVEQRIEAGINRYFNLRQSRQEQIAMSEKRYQHSDIYADHAALMGAVYGLEQELERLREGLEILINEYADLLMLTDHINRRDNCGAKLDRCKPALAAARALLAENPPTDKPAPEPSMRCSECGKLQNDTTVKPNYCPGTESYTHNHRWVKDYKPPTDKG